MGTGIPIINLRWSHDCLRLIIGIIIPIRQCLIEKRPWLQHQRDLVLQHGYMPFDKSYDDSTYYPTRSCKQSYFFSIVEAFKYHHCAWYNIYPYNLEPHDDVIKWKHFPHNWPFVQGIHRSLVNSPHKGQWRGALMFSLICIWINYWVNNREAGDLRCYRAHYDVIVLSSKSSNS